MEASVARDIYVDCIHREPAVAMEALRRHVQALRPGASCLIVLSDEPRAIDAVRAWCATHGVRHALRGHAGYWSVRLFLLPQGFGELPPAVLQERPRAA